MPKDSKPRGTDGASAELRRLLGSRRYVRLMRSPKCAENLDGFVAAVGAKWALLQITRDGGYFDGWNAFRIADVQRLRVQDDSFQRRVSEKQEQWPPTTPLPIELDRTSDLLRSLETEKIIGIEKERARSALWIGHVVDLEKGHLWLHEVDPQARWADAPLGYRLRAITRVQIRIDYLTALSSVTAPLG